MLGVVRLAALGAAFAAALATAPGRRDAIDEAPDRPALHTAPVSRNAPFPAGECAPGGLSFPDVACAADQAEGARAGA